MSCDLISKGFMRVSRSSSTHQAFEGANRLPRSGQGFYFWGTQSLSAKECPKVKRWLISWRLI